MKRSKLKGLKLYQKCTGLKALLNIPSFYGNREMYRFYESGEMMLYLFRYTSSVKPWHRTTYRPKNPLPKPCKDAHVQFDINIPINLKEKLDKMARDQCRSLNCLIMSIMKNSILF